MVAGCLSTPPPTPTHPNVQWTIHPWVHNSCNQLTVGDQLRGVQVPDVHPAALAPGAGCGVGRWGRLCVMQAAGCWQLTACGRPPCPASLQPYCFGRLPAANPTLCPSAPPHTCCPLLLPPCAAPGLLSMSAGDFVEVYRSPEYAASFDAVACCFFLDTAHNILEYLAVVWAVLKVRADYGVWAGWLALRPSPTRRLRDRGRGWPTAAAAARLAAWSGSAAQHKA